MIMVTLLRGRVLSERALRPLLNFGHIRQATQFTSGTFTRTLVNAERGEGIQHPIFQRAPEGPPNEDLIQKQTLPKTGVFWGVPDKTQTLRKKGPSLFPVGSQESVLKVPKRGQLHAAVRVTTKCSNSCAKGALARLTVSRRNFL